VITSPFVYIPEGIVGPGASVLPDIDRIMQDVTLAFARKTGRRLQCVPARLVWGPMLPFGQIRDHAEKVWRTVNGVLAVDEEVVNPSLKVVFIYGMPADQSGCGADDSYTIGNSRPDMGGLATIGWGRVADAQHARFHGRTANERLEYMGCIALTMHEIGHALGLLHPPEPPALQLNSSTIMGYAQSAFALGSPGANPMLFTDAELTTLIAHQAFEAKTFDSFGDTSLMGLSQLDAEALINGTVSAAFALVMGRPVADYLEA